jgi:hypothetical protein
MQFYRLSHSHCNGTATMGKTSRWVVPASRLFSLVFAWISVLMNVAKGDEIRAKAACPT